MTEHPIIFSAEMVLAIIEGRKTKTRRAIKVKTRIPGDSINEWAKSVHRDGKGNWVFWSCDTKDLPEFTKKAYPNGEGIKCPYGKPSDHLWVRETWQVRDDKSYYTKADRKLHRTSHPECVKFFEDANNRNDWRSPIYMPRWASRLTLEITNVRVERLQDITDEDAKAEGVIVTDGHINCERLFSEVRPDLKRISAAQQAFCDGWEKLNAKRGFGWSENPWVWVIEFKRI